MPSPNLPPGFDFTDPDIYAERIPVEEFAELRAKDAADDPFVFGDCTRTALAQTTLFEECLCHPPEGRLPLGGYLRSGRLPLLDRVPVLIDHRA